MPVEQIHFHPSQVLLWSRKWLLIMLQIFKKCNWVTTWLLLLFMSSFSAIKVVSHRTGIFMGWFVLRQIKSLKNIYFHFCCLFVINIVENVKCRPPPRFRRWTNSLYILFLQKCKLLLFQMEKAKSQNAKVPLVQSFKQAFQISFHLSEICTVDFKFFKVSHFELWFDLTLKIFAVKNF